MSDEYSIPEEDELTHLKQIVEEIHSSSLNDLNLAGRGSSLCLRALNDKVTELEASDSLFVFALLAKKIGSHVRACHRLLSAGYYSEAAMLIRTAIEAMSYFALFSKKPEIVEDWVAIELSIFEGDKEVKENAIKQKKEVRGDALRALRDYINEQANVSIQYKHWVSLIQELSQHVHPSLPGIVDELGEPITPWHFLELDDELDKAWQAAGDLVSAVRLRRLANKNLTINSRFPDSGKGLTGGGKVEQDITLSVSFLNDHVNDRLLLDLSMYVLLISHHLAHLLEVVWPDIWRTSKSLRQEYESWHDEVISDKKVVK